MGLVRLYGAALFLALLASCTSGRLKPATSRLAPWTTELRDQQPEDASVAVYRRGQAHLIFVGALHENQTDSATFRMIQHAYAGFDINVVITEGYPTSKGPNPPRLMAFAGEEARSGFQESGETVPTIAGAIEEAARVWGGEPDDPDIKSRLLAQGFLPKDLLGYYVLRVVPQWVRERKIEMRETRACGL